MIKVIREKISAAELAALCLAHFETMVKFVIDIGTGTMAVGGEMHADAEALLLQQGSRQGDLWGGNFYPWNAPETRVEFTSFINIRPSDDNAAMEVLDPGMRVKIVALAERFLLGSNEEMPGAAP